MVALFVVAGTFALLVQQRAREIALLRAVAATPRQVRRMIYREAQVVAVAAGTLGAIPAVALADWLRGQFVARGLLPETFTLQVSPLPVLAALAAGLGTAWLAAWVAARRLPDPPDRGARRGRGGAQADGPWPARRRPRRPGLQRRAAGAVDQLRGEAAAASGAGVVVPLVTAAALLSPILARISARVLSGPLQMLSRTTGYLAVANTRANRRLGAAIPLLILALGVGGVTLFQYTTLTRGRAAGARGHAGRPSRRRQHRPARQAGHDGPEPARCGRGHRGDPDQRGGAVHRAWRPDADLVQRPGSPQTLAQTMDLGVRAGSLDDLGEGTVAVSWLAAGTIGAEVGELVRLRLGDGTLIQPKVVAIYDRGLGFGDFTLHGARSTGTSPTRSTTRCWCGSPTAPARPMWICRAGRPALCGAGRPGPRRLPGGTGRRRWRWTPG